MIEIKELKPCEKVRFTIDKDELYSDEVYVIEQPYRIQTDISLYMLLFIGLGSSLINYLFGCPKEIAITTAKFTLSLCIGWFIGHNLTNLIWFIGRNLTNLIYRNNV